ncbi:hypothetical protein Bca101_057228 [Brassica carinata]
MLAGKSTVAHDDEACAVDFADSFAFEPQTLAEELHRLSSFQFTKSDEATSPLSPLTCPHMSSGEVEKEKLPSPLQAAAASALAFSAGAIVPLLAAAFVREYRVRIVAVVAAVTVALVAFGWLGAALGKAPAVRSSARVLFGGWLAMAVTFGLTKLIGLYGL